MSEHQRDELTNATCKSDNPADRAEKYTCQSIGDVSQLSISGKDGSVIPMMFPIPVSLHAHSALTSGSTTGAQSSTGCVVDGTAHTNAPHGNSQIRDSNVAASSELDTTAPTALPTFKAIYYQKGCFGRDHPNKTIKDPERLYLYDQGPPSAFADFDVTINPRTGKRQLSAFVSGEKREYENDRPVTVRSPFEKWIGDEPQTAREVTVFNTRDGEERWFVGTKDNGIQIPDTDRMVKKWEGRTVLSLPIVRGTADRLLAEPVSVTSEA
jgi:hypothetical protein